MAILVNLIVSAIVILIAAYLIPGVHVDNFWTAVVVAVVLGLMNAFVKPVLLFLTLPINILTLGLFTFVINALLILLVARIVPGFQVAGFWWAFIYSIMLSLINILFHSLR